MSFAKKHKKGVIDWGVDTKDFEYFKLGDLYEMNGADEKYVLKGVFINKNKTEKQLIFAFYNFFFYITFCICSQYFSHRSISRPTA